MSSWTAPLEEFGYWLAETPKGKGGHLRSGATVDTYVRHVTWLSESVPCGPWELTSTQIADWLAGRGWSQHTQLKVLVSLRAFYAWAVAEGHLQWAPTAGLSTSLSRKRGPVRRELPPAWHGPLEEYLSWLRAGGRSQGTQTVRRYWVARLAEVSADPWAVTGQQLAQFLSTPDWQPESRRSGRSAFQGFYRWAVTAGYLDESPAAALPTVMRHRGLPRPAPTEAIREAVAHADDRVRIAIMLASYAGLRRAEVASLHTRNIGTTDLVVKGKGGHERRIPMHPDLAGELHAELARRRRGSRGTGFYGPFVSVNGYLFPSDSHSGPMTAGHLGRIVSAALPGEWTTHALRHWFATSAYQAERDLRAVQELLGHSRPETTAVYAAVPEGALTRAVAGLRIS